MNLPSEDLPPAGDATFRRRQRQVLWFAGVFMIASFTLPLLAHRVLPPPVRPVVVLGAFFLFLCVLFGLIWRLAQHATLVKQMRPAARRYLARFLPAMLLYVVVFEAATFYYLRLHPAGLAAVLAGLAPSVPVLFAIRAMMLFLKEETDEYLRAFMLEGWSLATGLTLALCTVWGFLDQFEVVPHLPLWAAFPLWALCLLPAYFILQKRRS
jgi:hypothetical protein